MVLFISFKYVLGTFHEPFLILISLSINQLESLLPHITLLITNRSNNKQQPVPFQYWYYINGDWNQPLFKYRQNIEDMMPKSGHITSLDIKDKLGYLLLQYKNKGISKTNTESLELWYTTSMIPGVLIWCACHVNKS